MRHRAVRRERRLGLAWVASMGAHVLLAVACLLLGAPHYEQATSKEERETGFSPEDMIKFDLVASAEAAPAPQIPEEVPAVAAEAPAKKAQVHHRRQRAAIPEVRPPVEDEVASDTEPTDSDDSEGETTASTDAPKTEPKPASGSGAGNTIASNLLGGAAPSGVAARIDQPTDVSPSEATYLRTYETFPSLPRSLWVVGRVYNVMTHVCVSAEGRVTGVAIRSGAAPELDQLLVSTMRSWRYRPRYVDGAARPFCHLMKVQYAVR
jgi:outer membrane biosynthesis protein TonB